MLLLLVILTGAFFWYVSDYYRAEDVALEVLAQNDGIVTQDNLTILSPSYQSDTAIIFYPGAKVEAEAYLPLLDQIRQTGITCILVDMPFHMAIFDSDAAEDVMTQFPEIEHWYLAGHSMGGAMASKFAAEHPDEVDGLILMGAYIYGDYPVLVHGEKAHSRYFSEDAFKKLSGNNKELMIVPRASHTDLYDRVDIIPFDRIEAFFKANL